MEEFVYFLRPARATFPAGATPEEIARVDDHFEYLKRALAAGRLVLAGRTMTSSPRGIVVFEAASEDDARAFMAGDPAVGAGVFIAELDPFRVALCR